MHVPIDPAEFDKEIFYDYVYVIVVLRENAKKHKSSGVLRRCETKDTVSYFCLT